MKELDAGELQFLQNHAYEQAQRFSDRYKENRGAADLGMFRFWFWAYVEFTRRVLERAAKEVEA